MTPIEIKEKLKERKIKQREIARQCGVSEMQVSRIVNRKEISDRVMQAVARAIDMDHRAVFPEYYFGPRRRSTSKVASL